MTPLKKISTPDLHPENTIHPPTRSKPSSLPTSSPPISLSVHSTLSQRLSLTPSQILKSAPYASNSGVRRSCLRSPSNLPLTRYPFSSLTPSAPVPLSHSPGSYDSYPRASNTFPIHLTRPSPRSSNTLRTHTPHSSTSP